MIKAVTDFPFAPMRRPQSAPARPARGDGADKDIGKPDWKAPPDISRPFGDPPAPNLTFLRPRQLPEQLRNKEPKMRHVCKFQIADCVKNNEGVVETNIAGQSPRPRSGTVMKVDLANMVAKPYQISETVREAVYLIRCDSTDTLLARGKTFWVHEKNLEQRPLGAPRDFCPLHQPRWSRQFGGISKLFSQIAADQERIRLKAEMAARPPPEARPRSAGFAPSARTPRPTGDADVPRLRRRRQCPPSCRVRLTPQPVYRQAPPLMAFGIDGDGGAVPPPPLSPRGAPPSPRAGIRKSIASPRAGLAGAMSQPAAAEVA